MKISEKIGNQGIFEVRLSLYSDLLATGKNGKVTNLTGKGNVIFIRLFTSHFDSLDNGEYVFNFSNNLGTFKDPQYILGWDASDKQVRWTFIVSARMEVNKDDDYYDILLNGVDEFGNTVQCVYKGILMYPD
ncbi:MAG: hypothetical protein HC906_15515 [Bacteroidales bacterium]|nr:hypothetical protein [Bacteroidales bacterium]